MISKLLNGRRSGVLGLWRCGTFLDLGFWPNARIFRPDTLACLVAWSLASCSLGWSQNPGQPLIELLAEPLLIPDPLAIQCRLLRPLWSSRQYGSHTQPVAPRPGNKLVVLGRGGRPLTLHLNLHLHVGSILPRGFRQWLHAPDPAVLRAHARAYALIRVRHRPLPALIEVRPLCSSQVAEDTLA